MLGAERQVMMSPEDRRRTAYHEGGHAIVGMLTEGADPVRKISIIPRGLALGVTFAAPESDRFNYLGARGAGEDHTSRSAVELRRRSCSARRAPARSPTSSSSRRSPARWLSGGDEPKAWARGLLPTQLLSTAARHVFSQRTREVFDDEVRESSTRLTEVISLLREERSARYAR